MTEVFGTFRTFEAQEQMRPKRPRRAPSQSKAIAAPCEAETSAVSLGKHLGLQKETTAWWLSHPEWYTYHLKNMRKSVGIIVPNIWKNNKMFQTTDQITVINYGSTRCK